MWWELKVGSSPPEKINKPALPLSSQPQLEGHKQEREHEHLLDTGMMKDLKMSLLVALFLGILLQHSHSARAPNLGHDCCITYTKAAIPFSKLVAWFKTPTDCRKEAIVFVTVLKKSICANPNEKWVKKAISFLAKGKKRADSNPETNSDPQNLRLFNPTPASSQTPFNNSAQLPSGSQLNSTWQTNSTQHVNSTSLTSSSHLKN
ncbi:C-C motif chemokine 2-like [Monodelphis domestica]|uniref:C-C motif chemokine n=1 Tax=Monodelphis domestica TaxID=13616 RepID=F7G3N7_MONDO|nr:C-C motif chemokine 2-like [Monodelphis domestica]